MYIIYTVDIYYDDNVCRPSAFAIKAGLWDQFNRQIRSVDSGKLENSGLLRIDAQ